MSIRHIYSPLVTMSLYNITECINSASIEYPYVHKHTVTARSVALHQYHTWFIVLADAEQRAVPERAQRRVG